MVLFLLLFLKKNQVKVKTKKCSGVLAFYARNVQSMYSQQLIYRHGWSATKYTLHATLIQITRLCIDFQHFDRIDVSLAHNVTSCNNVFGWKESIILLSAGQVLEHGNTVLEHGKSFPGLTNSRFDTIGPIIKMSSVHLL